MKQIPLEIETSDHLQLRGSRWEPNSKCSAALCLVHGLGEHTGRYQHVAKSCCETGTALVGIDLRGHGKSAGKLGHAPSFKQLLEDISCMLDATKKAYPSVPLFLYGHSLGGNLVLNYVLKKNPTLAGAIATAPLFRPTFAPPKWKTASLPLLQRILPDLTLPNGISSADLSRDPAVGKAYDADPLVHDKISTRLGYDMLQAGQWNLAHADELHTPLLLMHGDNDRITCPKASHLFAKTTTDYCHFKAWNGLYHEIHNEPQQVEVLTYMTDWILKQTQ